MDTHGTDDSSTSMPIHVCMNVFVPTIGYDYSVHHVLLRASPFWNPTPACFRYTVTQITINRNDVPERGAMHLREQKK